MQSNIQHLPTELNPALKNFEELDHPQRVLRTVVEQSLPFLLALGFAASAANKRLPSQPGSQPVRNFLWGRERVSEMRKMYFRR
jgi:hypothetical protein